MTAAGRRSRCRGLSASPSAAGSPARSRIPRDLGPHSFYLLTLLRTGAVGLLALLALTVGLLRGLWSIAPLPTRTACWRIGVFPALLTMQLLWFITWCPAWSRDHHRTCDRPGRAREARGGTGRPPTERPSVPAHRERVETWPRPTAIGGRPAARQPEGRGGWMASSAGRCCHTEAPGRLDISLDRLSRTTSAGRVQFINDAAITVVLDVGAHVREYASSLRRFAHQFDRSFEPLARAFSELASRATADPLWTFISFPIALLVRDAHLSRRGRRSGSSALDILNRRVKSAPESACVRMGGGSRPPAGRPRAHRALGPGVP